MIVGPTKALFIDEITNGLDGSTAFQSVTCLQQMTHITHATVLVSLLLTYFLLTDFQSWP